MSCDSWDVLVLRSVWGPGEKVSISSWLTVRLSRTPRFISWASPTSSSPTDPQTRGLLPELGPGEIKDLVSWNSTCLSPPCYFFSQKGMRKKNQKQLLRISPLFGSENTPLLSRVGGGAEGVRDESVKPAELGVWTIPTVIQNGDQVPSVCALRDITVVSLSFDTSNKNID